MTGEGLSQFLSSASRERAEASWREGSNVDVNVDLDEILDRNLRESTESITGVNGPLPRWLALRLKGALRRQGTIDTVIATELLSALNREVREAASSVSQELLSFELVGLSPGSSILHLEPAVDLPLEENTLEETALNVEADPIDQALASVFDLHARVHARADIRMYADNRGLLRGFKDLATSLDRHGLELEMSWRSATGRRRRGLLDRNDLEYARTLWEEQPETTVRSVTGIVTELILNGSFAVKRSIAKNAEKFEIHMPDGVNLVSLGLQLGQTVTATIREISSVDAVGVVRSTKYEFVRLDGREPGLPIDGLDGEGQVDP